MHNDNPYRTCGVAGHLRDMTLEEIKLLDPCFEEKFGTQFKGKLKVPTLEEMLIMVKEKIQVEKLGFFSN